MADVTKAIEPKSDQANAEDFLGGPRTFTITRVAVRDSPDQPISVWLEGFPQSRPWKPAKTMAKLMNLAWTAESDNWVGKRVTLYTDPDVMFGPNKMGGIRISHMSGIGRKPLTANLATTRGKRAPWTVEPIPDGAAAVAKVPGPMDQLVWAMNSAGIEQDPAARLAYCRGIVQTDLKSAADLTESQLAEVMAALSRLAADRNEQDHEQARSDDLDLEPSDEEIAAAREGEN